MLHDGGDGLIARLTARERQVAELLAEDRSKQEIAERLVVLRARR